MNNKSSYEFVIIGAGFYGCCLALFLRSVSDSVLIVEAEDDLLNGASFANQARIHTGFHYPRSVLTAVKSLALHQKFKQDFKSAVNDEFEMLYAIAKRGSKVSSGRFYRMFTEIGAEIFSASGSKKTFFNADMIDDVFECNEAAFDAIKLKCMLVEKLKRAGVNILFSTKALKISEYDDKIAVETGVDKTMIGKYVFNVTYSKINELTLASSLDAAPLKHELAEIALVEPYSDLNNLGVTVMDGPFFSCMPFPATGDYSLTHVRYTPHHSWIDDRSGDSFKIDMSSKVASNYIFMKKDASRYMPSMQDLKYKKSIFVVKSVLLQNEVNDGRPILYMQDSRISNFVSILGGKIDNIYDLFGLVKRTIPRLSSATDIYLVGDNI